MPTTAERVIGAYDAVVAGHLCLDVIPDLQSHPGRFETHFVPGRLLDVGPVTLSTGGTVSNTGLALHRLGIRTLLMGKIGDDLFGQAVRQLIESHDPHLADAMVIDPGVATSYTIIVSPPGVDRIFLHCPAANDSFGAEDVRYDVLSGVRLFHFGYPPLMKRMYADVGAGGRPALAELFRRAKQTGVTTSLDLALPDPTSPAGRADWGAILAATLPYVDLFMPSIDEILYMLRRDVYEELRRAGLPGAVTPELLSDLGRQIVGMGVKIVGLKLGDRGFYVRTADATAVAAVGRAGPLAPEQWARRELWAPCFQVNVIGTAGSGDATIAGFLSAMLRGFAPEAAALAAVAVGACNVEAADTLSGVLAWEDTLRRIESGWPQRPLALGAPGWRSCQVPDMAGVQIWVGPGHE